eukprot:UN25404
METSMNGLGLEIVGAVEEVVVTKRPTSSPHSQPSSMPSTSLPSKDPTDIGNYVQFEAYKSLEEEISPTELEDLTSKLSDLYDAPVETEYQLIGYIGLITPPTEDESVDAMLNQLESALSNEFDVHEQNIELEYDVDTGFVKYEISNPDFDPVDALKSASDSGDFIDNLNDATDLNLP